MDAERWVKVTIFDPMGFALGGAVLNGEPGGMNIANFPLPAHWELRNIGTATLKEGVPPPAPEFHGRLLTLDEMLSMAAKQIEGRPREGEIEWYVIMQRKWDGTKWEVLGGCWVEAMHEFDAMVQAKLRGLFHGDSAMSMAWCDCCPLPPDEDRNRLMDGHEFMLMMAALKGLKEGGPSA